MCLFYFQMNMCESDNNEITKLKYRLLKKKYDEIKRQNKKTAEKIYQITKVIAKMQKRKKRFIKRLEGYKDNYRLCKKKFAIEDNNEWTTLSPKSTVGKTSTLNYKQNETTGITSFQISNTEENESLSDTDS